MYSSSPFPVQPSTGFIQFSDSVGKQARPIEADRRRRLPENLQLALDLADLASAFVNLPVICRLESWRHSSKSGPGIVQCDGRQAVPSLLVCRV
jgi:hypothetical protein